MTSHCCQDHSAFFRRTSQGAQILLFESFSTDSMSHTNFLSYFLCVCSCCSYPLLVPYLSCSVFFLFFFFNYQTVAVSYHSKLSLSHSGSASLSLLAHLFLPSKQWHTGSRQGKQLPQLSKNRSVCIYELYTSSVKEKFQVNIIKYQKDNGKAWLNHHSDVLELFLCR